MTDTRTASLRYVPRGRGRAHDACFICGGEGHGYGKATLKPNLAALVDSAVEGDMVVDMFSALGLFAWVDRDARHAQVKIGACPRHVRNLDVLGVMAHRHGDRISQSVIRSAVAGAA